VRIGYGDFIVKVGRSPTQWSRFANFVTLFVALGTACKETGGQSGSPSHGKANIPSGAIPPGRLESVRAVGGGPGSKTHEGDDPKKATARCEELCSVSASLRCKNARECVPRCQSMVLSLVCRNEMDALLQCLLKQPARNWECDEDGIGAIRDPYCGKEQELLALCLDGRLGS
jgi:hypothetical protein